MAAKGFHVVEKWIFSCFSGRILPIVLLMVFSAVVREAAYSQSWNFIKEKTGIKVYTRQEKNNLLKTFRGEADIHASSDKVYAIIGNVKGSEHWDENIRELRVLSEAKDKKFSYYLIYKIPWPLHDRDLCVEAKISRDTVTGEVIIDAQSVPDLLPEDKNLVRIRNYWQKWIIQPVDRNHIHLILEGFADPAGNVPGWLYNMVITETPLRMMQQVRQRVELR